MSCLRPSFTFSRPADTTAYASGDIVANSTTAGSVVLPSFVVPYNGFIRSVELIKSGTSVTNASFRLHLWGTLPSSLTSGDNAALAVNNIANYLGRMDVTLDQALSDGSAGFGVPVRPEIPYFVQPATPNGALLWGALEARAAYTPTSAESFTIFLNIFGL